GIITSSPACTSVRSAAISNAAVQEGVSSARFVPVCFSNQLLHSLPNGPFPASLPLFIASFIASCSLPMTLGLLKGINAFPPLLRMIGLFHNNNAIHNTSYACNFLNRKGIPEKEDGKNENQDKR